ncbi:MAG: histidine phosphatase family protein [Acidimicrobiales bacterium]|jgi:probable phosphoglycerate mutase
MAASLRSGFDVLSGVAGGSLPEQPPPGIRTVSAVGATTATRLVLIRHGEAECNVSGVCGGPKGCTGLTERGVNQVKALRLRLGTTGGLAGADALYASVLARAVQTAELVAPVLREVRADGSMGPIPAVQVDCGLCELHPGQADGLDWVEFSERFGDPDWDNEPERPIAPGGESWAGFVRRVTGTLEQLVARHPGELVVVACHAGVIEASLLAMLPVAGGREGARLQLRTSHASLTTWEIDGERWRLLGYNDAAHLGPPAGAAADQQA